jgi:serine/threonine-protein kinase
VKSTPHAGIVLADSKYESETNAYLQRRMAVFYGVMLTLLATLYVVDTILIVPWDGWTSNLVLAPSRLVHLGAVLGVAAILVLLLRKQCRERALVILDILGFHVVTAACVAVYALVYEQAPGQLITLVALFIIARAVIVPSSARTTLLLSVPAPMGMLVVQLAYGTQYIAEDLKIWPEDFAEFVIWNQVMLVFAVGIATVASLVNFRLRQKVRAARKLGQYHLEEQIGQGAMGEVHRASHAMLRRPTAIKLIRPDTADPEMLQRFEREVRETSRLMHPNTISIYDYGRAPDGVFYYAMEFLDGPDLRQAVDKTGPMPPARVIHLLCQVTGALREAHEAGLVHRDIKPGNLVLCRRGSDQDMVKVVDFGLVKRVGAAAGSSLTAIGEICGTPETLAPEVLQGELAGPPADLYALGVVAYFLLTGIPVFEAKSAADFVGHHLHTPPPPLRDRDAALPPDLCAAVERCLQKDPAQRFESALAFQKALEQCRDAGGWTESDAAAWWREMGAA